VPSCRSLTGAERPVSRASISFIAPRVRRALSAESLVRSKPTIAGLIDGSSVPGGLPRREVDEEAPGVGSLLPHAIDLIAFTPSSPPVLRHLQEQTGIVSIEESHTPANPIPRIVPEGNSPSSSRLFGLLPSPKAMSHPTHKHRLRGVTSESTRVGTGHDSSQSQVPLPSQECRSHLSVRTPRFRPSRFGLTTAAGCDGASMPNTTKTISS
jgi:hypothetical protein